MRQYVNHQNRQPSTFNHLTPKGFATIAELKWACGLWLVSSNFIEYSFTTYERMYSWVGCWLVVNGLTSVWFKPPTFYPCGFVVLRLNHLATGLKHFSPSKLSSKYLIPSMWSGQNLLAYSWPRTNKIIKTLWNRYLVAK